MKKKGRVEVVTMLGVYGFLVSAVELYPFHMLIKIKKIVEYMERLLNN